MPMSKGALLEMCKELFSPGKICLLISEMGMGKTSTALYFGLIMNQHFNYYVLSNIVLKKSLPDAEDGRKRWTRASYPGFFLVRSFSELFYTMARIRDKDSSAHFLLIFDEPVASGIGAHFSVFGKKMTGLLQFLTLLRKNRMAVVFTSLSSSLLPSEIRKKGGAFLSGILTKTKASIRKHAWHLLKSYDERSICLLEMPAWGPGFEILITEVEGLPLVTPEKDARVGDVIFDTESPASWSMGVIGKGSRKPFNMEHFLSYISDRLSHSIPKATLEYFEREGDVEIGFEGLSIEKASQPSVKGTSRWKAEVAFPAMREELPEILKLWKKRSMPSKAWFCREIQRALKKLGIELSLSSIKASYWPTISDEPETKELLKKFRS